MIKTLRKRNKYLALGIALIFPAFLGAVEIEHGTAPVENRFVVGPVKIEMEVPAGESRGAVIEIENRTGRTQAYILSIEGFSASDDERGVMLGEAGGEYSLVPHVSLSEERIVLEHGDRARMPITVSIPFGDIPGGRFASVLVSAESDAPTTPINAPVVGQVGVLLFVTVPGEIENEGSLSSFRIANDKKFVMESPIEFRVAYENRGNVHLNPYGGVTVQNMFGRTVATQAIDPWFVLPDSTRTRDIELGQKKLFGWYKATLELNRGYGDVVDTATVSFVVMDWKIVSLIVLFLVGAVFGIRKFHSSK